MTDYADRFARLTAGQLDALRVRLATARLSATPQSAGSAFAASHHAGVDRQVRAWVEQGDLHETRLQCSYAQSRLWFLEQWESGSGLYHIGSAWRVGGRLEVESLQRSVDLLVARHESLRTGFIEVQGEPVQRIVSSARVGVVVEDLAGDELGGEAALQARLAAAIGRPFDLREPPLLRVTVWRIGEFEQVLLLVIHHLVSDGWSQGVWNRELGVLYAAAVRGEEAALPVLPVQYADYALWQRESLTGARLTAVLGYWRTQLAGLPVLALPSDRPRPAQPSYRGAVVRFTLEEKLVEALRGLARRADCTLYMVLLAAFKVLLGRYSGQADVVVGSPVAGRERVELEGLIGFFVNTLVLRTRVAGELSFRELLGRVRETALGAYEHAEMPFEKLVEELRPVRDPSRNPLFQALLVLQNTPRSELSLGGLEVSPLGVDRASAKFDLSLSLQERAGGLSGVLEYATDLFDAATVARLAGHYRTLLSGIVADPEARVSCLPLLTAAERHQILMAWNATAVGYPRESTLSLLFEAQVLRTPDAVALVCGEQTLSYAALNARANQVAHYLRSVGVGPEVLVGVYLPRAVETVVGLLGILKAGGAYVPLDASYPEARVAFMLADTAAPVVLTVPGLSARLRTYAGRTVCLDSAGWLTGQPTHNPPPLATAENLAYVMYTSGSTGQPKGVMVSQRSVARLVHGADYISFSAAETFLLLAPTAFDASTFELWGALLHGARCVIYPQDVPTASGLETVIACHGITTLWLTAALFNALLDERPTALRGLRQLLIGGEALSVPHVRRALAALPEVRLINGYGPTESTTFTCCYHIPHELPAACRSVPIGSPIANTQVYILDDEQQPVPLGVSGELYIGGDGLARGYLRRPELTAARFIADPFCPEPGARLYRTGDRVRHLPDGNIEFLGRLDQQVKLRGFRIELGEIEAALQGLSAVRQAVVLLREDRPGDKRLVAYVVGNEGGLDPPVLRTELARTLPEYMVPTLVGLAALPLTANGKLDRAALPAPDGPVSESAAGSTPRDFIERHLVGVWESLFERAAIDIDQDFFALGGHSLLAVRLVDAVASSFGTRLPLDTLWFRGSTIRDMAELLRGQRGRAPWPMLIPIKPGNGKQTLFCVHTIGGNLFHYFELAKALSAAQPVIGLQARGVDGFETPRSRVGDIAADCITAMRTVQPRGPYRIAGFSSGGIVAFEMAQQLLADGDSVGLLALLDTYAPGMRRRARSSRLLDRVRWAVRPYMNLTRLTYAAYRLVGATPRGGFPDAASAHWWAHWGYRPSAYPGRVDLYLAERSRVEASEPCLGWSKLVAGELAIHKVPGSHGWMVKPPLVQSLADSLTLRLDEVAHSGTERTAPHALE